MNSLGKLFPFQRICKEEELMIMVLRSEAIVHGSVPRTQRLSSALHPGNELNQHLPTGTVKSSSSWWWWDQDLCCFFPEARGWAILSIMLGDCLHKISPEIGGRVAPPRYEHFGLASLHTKLGCHSAKDTRKDKQMATSYTSCRERFRGIIFKWWETCFERSLGEKVNKLSS